MNDHHDDASNSIHGNENVNVCDVDENDESNLNNGNACCYENGYVCYGYGDVANEKGLLTMVVVVVVLGETELIVVETTVRQVGC